MTTIQLPTTGNTLADDLIGVGITFGLLTLVLLAWHRFEYHTRRTRQ